MAVHRRRARFLRGLKALASGGAIVMRWKFAVFAIGLALAGCNSDSADQRTLGGAVIGAGSGAVIGGIAGGGRGAAIGAVVGGLTGAVIGRATTPNNCLYRDRDGRVFEARCL